MTTPNNRGQFIRLLDKRLREVFDGSYEELPSYREQLFRVISSDSAWEEFYATTGLPDFQPWAGKLPYATHFPGYYNRIEPKIFTLGVSFERELIDDKKYSVFDDTTRDLGEAAKRTQNKIEVEPFANGTSAAFNYQVSEEGTAIFSSSHTNKTGAPTAVGFSNVGTTAFSKTAVAAARLVMRKFRSDIGERFNVYPDTLIVPSGLADQAWELTNTKYGYETSAHTENIEGQRGWKIIELPRWDDTDTNNWAMVDSRMMKRFLIWVDRVKPEFNRVTSEFETFQHKYSGYMRCGWGAINWRFGFLSNVA